MKKLKVSYTKSPNFTSGFVTGVQGGIAPNGLLNINFFTDKLAVPDSFDLETDEAGRVLKELPKAANFTREVVCGIELDLATAKVINTWLAQKIKEVEHLRKTLKGSENESSNE